MPSTNPSAAADHEYSNGQCECESAQIRELLGDATVTILSERRRHAPYGLAGGAEGARGENRHVPLEGGERSVGGKASFPARRGDRVRMETPGGGGFG
jgi:N-methylhydantoinase B